MPMRSLVHHGATTALLQRAKGACYGQCRQQQHRQRQRVRGLMPLSSASARTIPDREEFAAVEDSTTAVEQLRELLDAAGGSVTALTGAGMSTDSGIPDYRGPKGSYSRGHKPMTHDQFLSSEDNRKRYWARSTFGWDSFSRARPNEAHVALAGLEAAGKVDSVITQNVDGLHQKAGSRNVVNLHGRNDKVGCMSCRFESSRDAYQQNLSRINARWIARHSPDLEGTPAGGAKTPGGTAGAKTTRAGGDPDVRLRADGDADVEPGAYLEKFAVPACPRCGGILKPTVVFFGDNIPRQRVEDTYRIVDESELLIAAGSSLQVYSAFRLVKRAADAGKKVVVINLGETRAERSGLDVLKVEAGVSNVLPKLLL
ncbi:unnamed protein product [Ectocarpus sp. 13 AM-2016]